MDNYDDDGSLMTIVMVMVMVMMVMVMVMMMMMVTIVVMTWADALVAAVLSSTSIRDKPNQNKRNVR